MIKTGFFRRNGLIIPVMEKRSPGLYFAAMTGIVMMAFMLASLTDRELFWFRFELFGFSFGIGLNAMEFLIPFIALVTDLSMYHALHSRLPVPASEIALHLFLPFAVTLTIGFTLRSMSADMTGWALLFVTGVLLYLVMRFEYVSCDPSSAIRPVSIIVLDSLCYAVYLLFIIALRANVSRLIITVPAIFVLCFVVSLKIYSSHVIGWDIFLVSAVTSLVICFADTGLHYWPINIISYGSLMFVWYYTFTSFVIGMDRNEPKRDMVRRLAAVWISAGFVLAYDLILK